MSSVDSIPFRNGVLILRCEYQSFSTIEIVMSILFNRRVSLQVDPITSTSARTTIISSQRCLFHPSPSCLCFSHPPSLLFSSRTKISSSSIHFIDGKFLHSFPSMFLSGDSHEDSNGASSSSFLIPFSSPVDSSQDLSIISPFSRLKYLLLTVLLIFIHFPLFNCSGVLKISRRFVFPLCIRSSSFEIGISFKSFNSTGATSLLNLFNGVLLSGP